MGYPDVSLITIQYLQLVVLLISNMPTRGNSICRIEIPRDHFCGALLENQLRGRLGEYLQLYLHFLTGEIFKINAEQLTCLVDWFGFG